MGNYTCDTLLPDGGNVAIVSGALGYSATIERTDGFTSTVAENCPDVTVIDTQPTDWSRQSATQIARDYVTKYGADGIDMIYAEDDTLAAGVAEGLEQSGVAPGDILLDRYRRQRRRLRPDDQRLDAGHHLPVPRYRRHAVGGYHAAHPRWWTIEPNIPIDSPVITPDVMSEFEPAY